MRWIKTALAVAGGVLLFTILLIAVVIGVVVGPPALEARNVVQAAERDGHIDSRTWQDALPPNVGAAIVAAEDFWEAPRNVCGCIPFVRTPSPAAAALANNLGDYSRLRTLRSAMTRGAVALMLDLKYRQDQLIDDYARQAYFGRNAHGIEQAARKWFGKTAMELSLQEAACLALLLKGPNNYDPARGPSHAERAKLRRDYVLGRMRELRFIDDDEAEAARAAPLGVIEARAETAH